MYGIGNLFGALLLIVIVGVVALAGLAVDLAIVRRMRGNQLLPTLLSIAAIVAIVLGINFSNWGLVVGGVFMEVVLLAWAWLAIP